MTTYKDFAILRNRGPNRRSIRRIKRLRKFVQVQKALDIPKCIWNYSSFADHYGSAGDKQIWTLLDIANVSDLNNVVAKAYQQEFSNQLIEATDVDRGAKEPRTRPALIISARYELSVQCINPFGSYGIDTPTGPVTGAQDSHVTSTVYSPVIFDVYFCDVKRNIETSDFATTDLLIGTHATPVVPITTASNYGAKLHGDGAESWATDLAVTPYDYTTVTRHLKILDRKRFVCGAGQSFQLDDTLYYNRVYRKDELNTARRGWTKAIIIAAYDSCNLTVDETHSAVKPGCYKTALSVRYSFKPIPTHTLATRA